MAKNKAQKIGNIIAIVSLIIMPFIVFTSWYNSNNARSQYGILLSGQGIIDRENAGTIYYVRAIKIYQNITIDFLLSQHLNNEYNLSNINYTKYLSNLNEANNLIILAEQTFYEEYSRMNAYNKNVNEEKNESRFLNLLNFLTYFVSIISFLVILIAYSYYNDYFKKKKSDTPSNINKKPENLINENQPLKKENNKKKRKK